MKVTRQITAFAILAFSPGVLSCDSEGGRETTAATVQPPLAIPSRLAIARQPSGAASGVALATQPIVHIRDAANAVVANSNAAVTAAISAGTGTLSGTAVVDAVNGIVTFTDLSVSGSGSHTLQFTSRGLTAATSSAIDVTGSATQLEIGTQPGNAVAGSTMAPSPVVRVLDASGNVVLGSSAAVTAAIASGTGILLGTRTVNAVQGVSTFTNLTLNGSGAHTLRFSAAGLTSATSTSFSVSGGPATQLAIATQPTSAVSGQPISPQPVVELRDASNAVVTSSTASVTATIASGSGALTGTTTVTAVNGIASFTNLGIIGSGPHTVTFTSGILTPVTTTIFDVTPAP